MLASFVSLSLRDPLAGKRLRSIPPDRAAEPAGYGTLADFSPLHLLQLDACTKCGRCHEACPANATGRPLSPRDVILELREQAHPADGRSGIGGLLGALADGKADGAGFTASVFGEDGVRTETVWSCMQCNACVEICPVGIEQAPIINQLRRRLVEEGELDSNLQATLEVIHKSGNSFGENKRKRGRWTKELGLRGPGRPQAAGRRAVVRRRLRLVRSALSAGDPYAGPPVACGRSRLRDPLRRRAQLRQRRAAGRRGGPVRDAGRAEHRHARRVASSNGSSPATRTRSTRCATSTPSSAATGR